MPSSHTDALIEFYGRPDASALLMEFVADAGGDPDQYGASDNSVETLLATGLGPALRIFTRNAVDFGLISEPSVATAARSDEVDWAAVAAVAEQTLMHGLLDI